MATTSQFTLAPKPMSMASLLSPPESKRMDSFNSPMNGLSRTPQNSFSSDNVFGKIRDNGSYVRGDRSAYASPPISPYSRPRTGSSNCMEGVEIPIKDPQLFNHRDSALSIGSDYPLFPQDQDARSVDVESVISEHIAKQTTVSPTLRPTRSEYMLAVSCVPKVAEQYNKDPKAWLRRERDLLFNVYGQKSKNAKGIALKRIAPAPSLAPRRQKIPTSTPRPARAPRPSPKRTPQSKVYDSFDQYSSISPKPARAPTNRDDVDYQSLPDYAPSIATLPKGNSKVLKADWKGQMLDLSSDPDRLMLHEAEVNLAATLRLSCATYLCSKRRIFQARIDALRIGKEFRKTDAQQACKIDVNKASKLWSAYEKVGWFNKEYFVHHL